MRADLTLSEELEVLTGLNERDSLSPLLFNIALDNIIRSVENNNLRTNIGAPQIEILRFADDFGESLETV